MKQWIYALCFSVGDDEGTDGTCFKNFQKVEGS